VHHTGFYKLSTQEYGGLPGIPGGMITQVPHQFTYGMIVLISGPSVQTLKERMMVKVFSA
jgi:hypothetical protein